MAPDSCDPQKKENRPEAADLARSKTRNQHWIDFLRSTAVVDSNDFCSAYRTDPVVSENTNGAQKLES